VPKPSVRSTSAFYSHIYRVELSPGKRLWNGRVTRPGGGGGGGGDGGGEGGGGYGGGGEQK
jgi:hypothetical protein